MRKLSQKTRNRGHRYNAPIRGLSELMQEHEIPVRMSGKIHEILIDSYKNLEGPLDAAIKVESMSDQKISNDFFFRAFELLRSSKNITERKGISMKITEKHLRKIIRESIMSESAKQMTKELLDRDYDLVQDKTDYPYGRYRGDVRRVMVYKRKDGQPVPESDVELLKSRDIQVRKEGGPMPALAGLYTSSLSQDGMSIKVLYTRHTAG